METSKSLWMKLNLILHKSLLHKQTVMWTGIPPITYKNDPPSISVLPLSRRLNENNWSEPLNQSSGECMASIQEGNEFVVRISPPTSGLTMEKKRFTASPDSSHRFANSPDLGTIRLTSAATT
ncbi:unnamed protein product [Fusarium graminearum]|uniref:Chromosome 3, complete genome n=1 Tax=Gibberella zeae (strain ATCC MYA-4620 / CBS 123657 / FGSC 9075 / NRRL 31084 / PH-1) TaxID=229533 RepID=A0A098E0X1_GIBZE|nr:unnamed protein product [Fusarium graminearum]CZS83618.1 unnamed protein product [Fusarium graminearum]